MKLKPILVEAENKSNGKYITICTDSYGCHYSYLNYKENKTFRVIDMKIINPSIATCCVPYHLILVLYNAKVKENDYIYVVIGSDKIIHKCISILRDGNNKEYINVLKIDGSLYSIYLSEVSKILLSTNPLHELPSLDPKSIEELVKYYNKNNAFPEFMEIKQVIITPMKRTKEKVIVKRKRVKKITD